MQAKHLLHHWLQRQLPEPAMAWLQGSLDQLTTHGRDRDLYLSISLVSRKLGKDDLRYSAGDLIQANRIRPGWDPRDWSVDQGARILILLSAPGTAAEFAARLERLCNTADVGELMAFYRGLPLYPDQARYRLRAAEGIRSNMKAVFEAVAHRNPYPAEQLSQEAWNQMVLKALFIGSKLDPIVGLDTRVNPTLTRMLSDYAHERWAAGRSLSPELWRCVGPCADASAVADLHRTLQRGSENEQKAAALALGSCPHPDAKAMLASVPALREGVANGTISWHGIAATC